MIFYFSCKNDLQFNLRNDILCQFRSIADTAGVMMVVGEFVYLCKRKIFSGLSETPPEML